MTTPDEQIAEQEIDQQLVAYLDHELSPEERADVEARLGKDSAFRDRVRRLQASWDLLDRLPRAEVDDKFARSTVTMVALSAGKEVEAEAAQAKQANRRQRVTRIAFWVTTLAIGFLLVRIPMAVKHRRELRDVPVIQNMDALRHAESIQFLRMLDQEGFFESTDEETQDVLATE